MILLEEPGASNLASLLRFLSYPLSSIGPNSFFHFWPNFIVFLISVSSCQCDDREWCFRNRIINKTATACTCCPLRAPSWTQGTYQWHLSLASVLVIHMVESVKLYFWSSLWPQMSKHVLLRKRRLHENSSQSLLLSLLWKKNIGAVSTIKSETFGKKKKSLK